VEVDLEIHGLEIYGYHGALPHEQERGQRFVYDISMVVHDAGVRSDKLQDTVDYTQVAACVREIGAGMRFNLIEALAAAIADALLARFDVSRVQVRVRKPEVELDDPVEFTAATVERSRR
jgi:dihydroneopterin aldolase